jgi:hypothetical protein
VAFDEAELIGQGAGFGVKDRNPCPAFGAEIQPCAVMVALAHAFVDQAELTGWVEHIAEGGEGGGG